jgi:hypothetical protein
MCPLKEENTYHILIKCLNYEKERETITEKIIMILTNLNTTNNNSEEIKKTLPMWFTETNLTDNSLDAYPDLSNFNKLAGIVGYIPKSLKGVVTQYLNNSENEKMKTKKTIIKTIKKIQEIILNGMYNIWRERNNRWDQKINSQQKITIVPNQPITYITQMPTHTNTGKTNDTMRGQEEENEIIDMTKPQNDEEEITDLVDWKPPPKTNLNDEQEDKKTQQTNENQTQKNKKNREKTKEKTKSHKTKKQTKTRNNENNNNQEEEIEKIKQINKRKRDGEEETPEPCKRRKEKIDYAILNSTGEKRTKNKRNRKDTDDEEESEWLQLKKRRHKE